MNSLAARLSRLLLFCGCLLAALACGWPVAGLRAAETPATAGPLFHEATHQFQTMTSTLYQHATRVDRAAGIYRYDCVGFVSYALKQAAPQARASAFKALEIQPGRIPSPPRYRQFLSTLAKQPQPGWQAVTNTSELRPGDVVAWERKTKTSSGHAVVIAGIPVAAPDGSWVVQVYDSTASPHGDDSRATDSRAEVLATNGKRSGLGRGLMGFTADPATGALTGYRWSPKSKPTTVPIAAGRPTS